MSRTAAEYSPSVLHGMTASFDQLFSEDLSRNHQRRIAAYREFWLYYLGRHWSYERDEGEPLTTINYCRKFVDRHTNFAFKKGFACVVPDDPATEENEKKERDFIRHLLNDTWSKNNQRLWCIEAGQMGGVTGDLFQRVSWENTDLLEEPYARVDIIPSHMVFPEFGGPHGVDRKKLRRCIVIVPVFTEAKRTSFVGRWISRGTKTKMDVSLTIRAEEWTSPVIDPDTRQITVPAKYNTYLDGELIKSTDNVLGEIPIVHTPNYPISGEYYGISDLVDLTGLNRELNERTTDVGDIIGYCGSPTTVLYGAKLAQLEKGANRMWGLPEGAKVENLELKGDLGAATAHISSVKNSMLEMGDMPESALGGSAPQISNTSGYALQLTNLPLIERRDVKVLTYGYGLRLVNRLIIRLNELADSGFEDKLAKLKGNKYRNEVVFPDPLPQDVRRALEISREELDQGLNSRIRILMEKGHTKQEAEEILEEVRKERQDDADLLFQKELGVGSGNATFDRGGADSTRGEKITDTLE